MPWIDINKYLSISVNVHKINNYVNLQNLSKLHYCVQRTESPSDRPGHLRMRSELITRLATPNSSGC